LCPDGSMLDRPAMSALDALLTRVAVLPGNLREPAPTGRDLACLLDAAVCAPDHGWLKPWRFLLVNGDARRELGALLREAYRRRRPEMDEPSLERIRRYPTRIPLLIGVVAAVKESQIPVGEQLLSAGAAAQNICLAAHALGYGAMWISSMIEGDGPAHEALGLNSGEQLVGWICLGSLRSAAKPKKRPHGADFTLFWHGPGQMTALQEKAGS
jgi:nitroreductase